VGGMMYQGAAAKFDKKTEKFQTWSLPRRTIKATRRSTQIDANALQGGWKSVGARCRHVFSPPVGSCDGKFEVFQPFPEPSPNIYDVISDSQTTLTSRSSAPLKSKDRRENRKITFYKTPTPIPRRAGGQWTRAATCGSANFAAIGSACSIRKQSASRSGCPDAVGPALRCRSRQEWRSVGWILVH